MLFFRNTNPGVPHRYFQSHLPALRAGPKHARGLPPHACLTALPIRLFITCKRPASPTTNRGTWGLCGTQVRYFSMPARRTNDGISEAFTEIENPFVKFKLTRFDLGEIEDIVDHTQQGFPRFPTTKDTCVGIHPDRYQASTCHSNDRIHGCPYFMTHVCEKITLALFARSAASFALRSHVRRFRSVISCPIPTTPVTFPFSSTSGTLVVNNQKSSPNWLCDSSRSRLTGTHDYLVICHIIASTL